MLISTLVTILLILLVSNATCSNLNSYKPIYNPGLQTKFTKSPAETAKFRTFTLYGSISQDIKNWLTDTLHQFDINNKVVDYKEVESMEGNVVGDVVVCQFRQQQLGWGSCDAMKNLEEVIYFASKSRKLQYIIVLLEDGLPARTIEMQKFIHDFISVMELKLGLKLSLKAKVYAIPTDRTAISVSQAFHHIVKDLQQIQLPSSESFSTDLLDHTPRDFSKNLFSLTDLKCSTMDITSISFCQGVVEDFLTIFDDKLSLLEADSKQLESTVKGALEYYDTVLENLQKLLEETNDEHAAMYDEELVEFVKSKGMIWSSELIRHEINKRLLRFYSKLLDNLKSSFVQIFQFQLLKLSPYVYKDFKKQIIQEYQLRLDILVAGFKRLSKWKLTTGVLAIPAAPKSTPPYNLYFQRTLTQLEVELTQIQEEALCKTILAGQHNSYVRTSPFPPCHINLNYLLDPSLLSRDNSEIKRYYDEHKDGYVPSRADSMKFPGIASVPFDPTAIPASKDDSEKLTFLDILFG